MKKHKVIEIAGTVPHVGFLGPGHTARTLISSNQFQIRDPFILLMDDLLDLPGGPPVGGPHPHAGFETVTLVIQGDEKVFETGSLELMTAGKGVIHSEVITTQTRLRILQLWLVLPLAKRWEEPFLQKLPLEKVPKVKGSFGEIRIYSGSSQGLVSPLRHHTPFMLVEYNLNAGASVLDQIPKGYNTFIYVLSGSLSAGGTKLEEGQVGWLDILEDSSDNEIWLDTAEQKAHFILCGGQPQHAPIVANGPFIGITRDDIVRLYDQYHNGEIPHLDNLNESSKLIH
ncbi:pirin family protein [Pedobacter panaciterrae]|uniref:pirin family protein n=1 Tax=Pedobacter panaciterrae TaxID=363849 RepID=UPI00259A2D69|nr:pirin-like C-terminal cupin domain-containing protein [uncultured Pedobacter sp.]